MDFFLQPKDSPCSPLEFRFKALFPCFTFQDPKAKKLPSELCNAPARKSFKKQSKCHLLTRSLWPLTLIVRVCVCVKPCVTSCYHEVTRPFVNLSYYY